MTESFMNSKDHSKAVEQYLANEKKLFLKYKAEPKLLILGSSDSGKSTLLKQLKIIHGNGFTDAEKELSKCGIIHNIITALATLLKLSKGPFSQEKKQVLCFLNRNT